MLSAAPPPLDHHYLAQHLGDPKRVLRTGEGEAISRDVALKSVTIVPAGAGFQWQTKGPIQFAHLYIAPRRLDRSIHDTPIHEIARQCGFVGPNRFATCFRKAISMAPSAYRQSR